MRQLDLFRHPPALAGPRPSDEVMRPVIAPETIEDDELLAALPHAGIADSLALAAEAGRRRMTAAVPALETLCRRFAGFGADRIVPEPAAALDPLLTRYLREAPSAELVDAVAPVADEECIILLGRIARAMPDLSQAALDALEAIDHPRAARIAAEIRQ